MGPTWHDRADPNTFMEPPSVPAPGFFTHLVSPGCPPSGLLGLHSFSAHQLLLSLNSSPKTIASVLGCSTLPLNSLSLLYSLLIFPLHRESSVNRMSEGAAVLWNFWSYFPSFSNRVYKQGVLDLEEVAGLVNHSPLRWQAPPVPWQPCPFIPVSTRAPVRTSFTPPGKICSKRAVSSQRVRASRQPALGL